MRIQGPLSRNLASHHKTGQDSHPRCDTFTQHSGKGSSQIDFILCTIPGLVDNIHIHDKHHLNTSSHIAVSATIRTSISKLSTNRARPSLTMPKYKWDKADICGYKLNITTQLQHTNTDTFLTGDPTRALACITKILTQASKKNVPVRKKSQHRNHLWSPDFSRAVTRSKKAKQRWSREGCPPYTHAASLNIPPTCQEVSQESTETPPCGSKENAVPPTDGGRPKQRQSLLRPSLKAAL